MFNKMETDFSLNGAHGAGLPAGAFFDNHSFLRQPNPPTDSYRYGGEGCSEGRGCGAGSQTSLKLRLAKQGAT